MWIAILVFILLVALFVGVALLTLNMKVGNPRHESYCYPEARSWYYGEWNVGEKVERQIRTGKDRYAHKRHKRRHKS